MTVVLLYELHILNGYPLRRGKQVIAKAPLLPKSSLSIRVTITIHGCTAYTEVTSTYCKPKIIQEFLLELPHYDNFRSMAREVDIVESLEANITRKLDTSADAHAGRRQRPKVKTANQGNSHFEVSRSKTHYTMYSLCNSHEQFWT